jgi:hypothetical protein
MIYLYSMIKYRKLIIYFLHKFEKKIFILESLIYLNLIDNLFS